MHVYSNNSPLQKGAGMDSASFKYCQRLPGAGPLSVCWPELRNIVDRESFLRMAKNGLEKIVQRMTAEVARAIYDDASEESLQLVHERYTEEQLLHLFVAVPFEKTRCYTEDEIVDYLKDPDEGKLYFSRSHFGDCAKCRTLAYKVYDRMYITKKWWKSNREEET